MLLERLDPQAGVDEGRDDLAEAVVPAVLLLLADVGGRVGVGALDVEDQRVAVLPVGVSEPQLAWRDALALETWKTGWASVMKNVPPGFTKCATTRAQPRMSGSQPSTPRDV